MRAEHTEPKEFLVSYYCTTAALLSFTEQKGFKGKKSTENCPGNKKHCSVPNVDHAEASELS